MQKSLIPFVLCWLVLSSGCAFYEKRFVSEVVLDGPNHRPEIYDEGVFYINAVPTVRMRVGCQATTTMVATMFPLIPIPFGKETPAHGSIANRRFSLTLWHLKLDRLDFSDLSVTIEIGGRVHSLQATLKEAESYRRWREYEFEAEISCGEVRDGQLTIELDDETTRRYGVQFEEGVQREVAWHPTFVT